MLILPIVKGSREIEQKNNSVRFSNRLLQVEEIKRMPVDDATWGESLRLLLADVRQELITIFVSRELAASLVVAQSATHELP